MQDYSEIKCPICGGKIIIDAKRLLQGASFNCMNPDCDSSVSLSSSSHQMPNNTMEEFEKLKVK